MLLDALILSAPGWGGNARSSTAPARLPEPVPPSRCRTRSFVLHLGVPLLFDLNPIVEAASDFYSVEDLETPEAAFTALLGSKAS